MCLIGTVTVTALRALLLRVLSDCPADGDRYGQNRHWNKGAFESVRAKRVAADITVFVCILETCLVSDGVGYLPLLEDQDRRIRLERHKSRVSRRVSLCKSVQYSFLLSSLKSVANKRFFSLAHHQYKFRYTIQLLQCKVDRHSFHWKRFKIYRVRMSYQILKHNLSIAVPQKFIPFSAVQTA